MYINPKDRAYWDSFVNPFLSDLHANHKNPPSQSGLAYALSRIIWSIFNRWPSWTVASGLRSVLIEIAAEFKRRKLDPFADQQLVENGDLPEGPLAGVFPYPQAIECGSAGPTATSIKGSEEINIQNLPPGCKIVKLSDLHKCIEEGKPLSSLLGPPPAPPVDNAHVAPGCETFAQSSKIGPLIIDPAAEAEAEAAHLLAIKAFSLARIAKAKDETLSRLSAKIADTTRALLKVYGVPQ